MHVRGAVTGGLFVSTLFLPGAAPPPPGGPTPILQGDAFVRAEGKEDFSPATEGTALGQGTSVRTAPGVTASMKVAPGVSVRIAPGTTFSIHSSSPLPLEHPGASPVRALQLQLLEGEIDLDAHDPADHVGLLILLPGNRSVALWRGTANVAIHGDNINFALYDGMGIAGSGGQWKPLPQHSEVMIWPKAISPIRPALAAPNWIDGPGATTPPFALVRGSDDRAVVGGEWQPVAGAAYYRVEVSPEPRMIGSLAISKSDLPVMKTDPVPYGAYYVRVRAVSSDGMEGPASSPARALRVTHLLVPPTAFNAPNGAIVITDRQTVKLDDPHDVEIATASEFNPNAPPRWVPATTELALNGNTKRTFLIRHVPSHVQSKVVLVSRQLEAHVSFNPPHPRWPETPVNIVVKAKDPSGFLDASQETLGISVLVNVNKQDLQWSHAGDTWTARLQPHPAPGPWVVRVNVADRSGESIGAGILDVDGPPLISIAR